LLRPHDPRTGAEVEPHEVVKGFQTEAGQLVTITPEEMRTLDIVEDTRALALATFVRQSELDPLYFKTPFFLYQTARTPLKRTGSSLPRWRKAVRQASAA
jgi:non-homologous end joining protein Ku